MLPPLITILLVVAVLGCFEDRAISIAKNDIIPPKRDIVHNQNFDQITEFDITIEKLGISTPISPNIDGQNKKIYDEALDNGVAHYKNTALPNSGSNIVIFGHSSTVLGIGKYSKIFSTLGQLNKGDEIKINFNQKEYTYLVSYKKIYASSNTTALLPTEREQLTLFTCWPVGTANKRLAVIAMPKK